MAHPFQKLPQPRETASFPRQFGVQAQRAAALIRLHPTLAQRLALAPRRAIHASAALLQVHAAEGVPLERSADLLLTADPRDVLRTAVPDAADTLLRTLDRALLPAWSLAGYRALNRLLGSKLAGDVATGDLIQTYVVQLATLLEGDPVVLRAHRMTRDAHLRQALATVVAVLRGLGALHDLDGLPDGAGRRAVARRARADLARLCFPATDLAVPEGWRRVGTVGQLWAHAGRLNLCISEGMYGAGDAVVSACMGRSVFLLSAAEDALAQVRAVPGGMWVVEQVAVASNGPLPVGLHEGLCAGLRQAGATLLPTMPQGAVDAVLAPLRRKGRGHTEVGPDDLDEDDETDDEQDEAA